MNNEERKESRKEKKPLTIFLFKTIGEPESTHADSILLQLLKALKLEDRIHLYKLNPLTEMAYRARFPFGDTPFLAALNQNGNYIFAKSIKATKEEIVRNLKSAISLANEGFEEKYPPTRLVLSYDVFCTLSPAPSKPINTNLFHEKAFLESILDYNMKKLQNIKKSTVKASDLCQINSVIEFLIYLYHRSYSQALLHLVYETLALYELLLYDIVSGGFYHPKMLDDAKYNNPYKFGLQTLAHNIDMLRIYVRLFKLTADYNYLSFAKGLFAFLFKKFYDENKNGFCTSSYLRLNKNNTFYTLKDYAIVTDWNSYAADCIFDLYLVTKDQWYRQVATNILLKIKKAYENHGFLPHYLYTPRKVQLPNALYLSDYTYTLYSLIKHHYVDLDKKTLILSRKMLDETISRFFTQNNLFKDIHLLEKDDIINTFLQAHTIYPLKENVFLLEAIHRLYFITREDTLLNIFEKMSKSLKKLLLRNEPVNSFLALQLQRCLGKSIGIFMIGNKNEQKWRTMWLEIIQRYEPIANWAFYDIDADQELIESMGLDSTHLGVYIQFEDIIRGPIDSMQVLKRLLTQIGIL